jgi:hypothetical protein
MKSIKILLIILLSNNMLFSQNISNEEVNRLSSFIKGIKMEFGEYNFNNFPCSTCSGGWFLHSTNSDKQEAFYSYKNVVFKGVLTNPRMEYFEDRDELYLTFNWTNTGNNGGLSNAMVRYEFNLNHDNSRWNTLIRFQGLSTEMVAFLFLNTNQMNSVNNYLMNTKIYKEKIFEKNKIKREKEFQDSLTNELTKAREIEKGLIEKKRKNELNRLKFISDSIAKSKHDSLSQVLNIGVIFNDGIVINFINQNEVAILSLEEKFVDYGDLKNMLNSNPDYYSSWQVPTLNDLEYVKSMFKKNELFRDNFNKNILPKTQYEYPSFIYWHTSGFKQLKASLMPLDFGFDYVYKYQNPNIFQARLRMIKRVKY